MQSTPAPTASLARRTGAFIAAAAVLAIGVGALTVPAGKVAADTTSLAIDYWNSLPESLPLDVALPQHTVVLDRNGNEFARFYSENRIDVKTEDISDHFIQALLATEDDRFFEHGPIDAQSTIRAFVSNARTDQTTQGGSTLTQQLTQNILINNARDSTEAAVAVGTTYAQKLRELKYAVGLEKELTKDQILNMYANTVYFGNSAYGVEAAAKVYFNTTAKELSLPQAAVLVGLLRGPTIYDPLVDKEAAKNRRDTVLARMATVGKISEEQAKSAQAEPITLSRGALPSGCAQSKYPFYCSQVRKEILTDTAFGPTPEARQDRLTRGGMVITTALDPKAMSSSQDAVNAALTNDNRAALATAVITPGTGHITALAQNRDWGTGPNQTEIVLADRTFQVGSSMKPITLATALEQGKPITLKLNSDSPYTPATLAHPDGGFINYGNISYGNVDAREAIKNSLNIYFIRLIEQTGVLPVADMASRLGITSLPRTGERAIQGQEASLTLGAYEVSPIEMANAYSVFISNGIACKPTTITAVTRADTKEPQPAPDTDCHQAIAPAVANTIADTLKQPFTPGGTLGALGGLKDREAGAKTGTTNDYAANWIVGFTAQNVAAVWLGDPRGPQHPLDTVHAYGKDYRNLTGSEVAAPVWKDLMTRISEGLPTVPLPKADEAASNATTAKAVPDVRGMRVDDAVTLLLQNDLVPLIEQSTGAANALFAPGIAIAQTPAAGSTFGYKQQVKITLSAGSDTSLRVADKK